MSPRRPWERWRTAQPRRHRRHRDEPAEPDRGGVQREPGVVDREVVATTTLPAVGVAIPYSFLVTNTGNVEMTGIAGKRSEHDRCHVPGHDVGADSHDDLQRAHMVTQAEIDANAVINSATVVGNRRSARRSHRCRRTRCGFSRYPGAGVVDREVVDARRHPAVGDSIRVSFLVTNTGNVTMTSITVSDPNTTRVTCPATTLAPQTSTTCTGSSMSWCKPTSTPVRSSTRRPRSWDPTVRPSDSTRAVERVPHGRGPRSATLGRQGVDCDAAPDPR